MQIQEFSENESLTTDFSGTGFLRQFHQFFHWILIKLRGWCAPMTNEIISTFKAIEPFGRWKGRESLPENNLSEFELTYVEQFLSDSA